MKKFVVVVVVFSMNKRRTAIDANLLIAAWSGRSTFFAQALVIPEDPERVLTVSDALWLEVMPKAIYHTKIEESVFIEPFLRERSLCLGQLNSSILQSTLLSPMVWPLWMRYTSL